MIIDQRAFHGVQTVEQVHTAWDLYLFDANERRVARGELPLGPIVDRSHEVELYGYVNWSMWVADCICGAGVSTWPDHPKACCLACFMIVRIKHPSKARIGECLPLLLERPEARRRCWIRFDGPHSNDPKRLDVDAWHADGWETVTRLRTENILIGGLIGDGKGDERDLIVSTYSMDRPGSISTADVTLPLRRQGHD